MNLRVKVKKVSEGVELPKYAKPGDAGFDLVAAEDMVIEPGETKVIATGLAFEIPPGYELQVRPRSGISLRTSLRVILGTVDSSYRGEVGVIVENATNTLLNHIHVTDEEEEDDIQVGYTNIMWDIQGLARYTCGEAREGSYLIKKGDRIAQGVVAPVETASFVECEELSESERGAGGFGSTGVRG